VSFAVAGGVTQVSPRGRQFSVNLPLGPRGTEGGLSVKAIAAGSEHSLALASDGTVWAWGRNREGQLGDGTTINRSTPVQVGGLSGVVAVTAGNDHSLVLKRDGTVWAWGWNEHGQLGDGTVTRRLAPVQVSRLAGVMAVAAGQSHSLALKNDGTVWEWPTTDSLSPIQVSELSGVVAVAGGGLHRLALKRDGTVCAWGSNWSGQLGDGTTTNRSTPVQVSGLSGVVAIAGGYGHSMAVTSDGTVWEWGRIYRAQLGMAATSYSALTPVQVSGLSGVVSVTAAPFVCWYGLCRFYAASGQVFELPNLAVRADGSVCEWGWQYGPIPVAGISDVQMAAGSGFRNVAVKLDGTVWEWGASDAVPTPVSGLSDVVAVATFWHSLALKRDGTVWGWGSNYSGELGDGTTTERATPVQVAGLSDAVAIDTRYGDEWSVSPHNIALKQDGTVWEWPIWQFDSYISAKSLVPVQVAGLTDIVAVAEGGGHSLALKRDGTVWAWGSNDVGQSGVRTFAIRTAPVQVVAPAP